MQILWTWDHVTAASLEKHLHALLLHDPKAKDDTHTRTHTTTLFQTPDWVHLPSAPLRTPVSAICGPADQAHWLEPELVSATYGHSPLSSPLLSPLFSSLLLSSPPLFSSLLILLQRQGGWLFYRSKSIISSRKWGSMMWNSMFGGMTSSKLKVELFGNEYMTLEWKHRIQINHKASWTSWTCYYLFYLLNVKSTPQRRILSKFFSILRARAVYLSPSFLLSLFTFINYEKNYKKCWRPRMSLWQTFSISVLEMHCNPIRRQ